MAAHADRPLTVPIRRAREAGAIAAKPVDIAGYWLVVSGVYVLVGFLWYYAAKAKIFDDNLAAPAGIEQQFSGTFIDSFPGIDVSWAILGILQGVVVLGLVASLVRGEFLPHRSKDLLLGTLAGSLFIFALLAFGQNMIAEHDSAASLYTYFAATAVLMVVVRLMPPYRSDRWLSGSDGSSSSEQR
jgi:hypothetical protein